MLLASMQQHSSLYQAILYNAPRFSKTCIAGTRLLVLFSITCFIKCFNHNPQDVKMVQAMSLNHTKSTTTCIPITIVKIFIRLEFSFDDHGRVQNISQLSHAASSKYSHSIKEFLTYISKCPFLSIFNLTIFLDKPN